MVSKVLRCERTGTICRELASCRRMEVVELASKIIKDGGLVVYPTDTLYGLGADALNGEAVGKVFEAKERPADAPLSVAVSDMEMMGRVAKLNEWTARVVEAIIPRPVTFLLPKRKRMPVTLTGGKDVVGVRVPNHMFALTLVGMTGPITTTSANLHDGHDPRTIRSSIRQLGEAVDLYVDCGRTVFGRGSTILDLTGGTADSARVVRKGAADPSIIMKVITNMEQTR
jgi:L-threonylcarbamoyladenylate synthase